MAWSTSAATPPEGSTRYRARTIDLDVKDADLQEVFRLLATVGRVKTVTVDGSVYLVRPAAPR